MSHTSHEDILFLAPQNENIIYLLRCHIYRLSLLIFFLAPRLLGLASFLQKIVKTTNVYTKHLKLLKQRSARRAEATKE
jgi:hypothetical protein